MNIAISLQHTQVEDLVQLKYMAIDIYIYNYIYSLLTIQFSTSYNRAKWAQVEDPVLDDRPGLALPLGGCVSSTAPTAA
jgi:hypothetical protein